MACGGCRSTLGAIGFAFTRGMAAVRSHSLLQDPLPERRDDRLHSTSCRELLFVHRRSPGRLTIAWIRVASSVSERNSAAASACKVPACATRSIGSVAFATPMRPFSQSWLESTEGATLRANPPDGAIRNFRKPLPPNRKEALTKINALQGVRAAGYAPGGPS